MPSFPRLTRIPNEFVAPQSFQGGITIVRDGVSIVLRPVWATVAGGNLRIGWEASRDAGQTWRDAGSLTHGA